MGSFNVACSISSLSIGAGTPVMFIPLSPSRNMDRISKGPSQYKNKNHIVGIQSMLHYTNCYFTPFCLPIEGDYNDYGTLENIVENDNVKAIEKFFGITIEQFMNTVTVGREWYDYFSGEHEAYADNPKLLSSYDIKFGPKFLKGLGFTKNKDGSFTHPNKNELRVEIVPGRRNEEEGFVLFKGTEELCKEEGYDAKRKLLEKFYDYSEGYYLGVAPEKHEKLTLIRSLSGMFVHKEVYDELAKGEKEVVYDADKKSGKVLNNAPTEAILLELGFQKKDKTGTHPVYTNQKATFYSKGEINAELALTEAHTAASLTWKKNGKEKTENYIFSVQGLAEHWKKATGESLDVAKYGKMYQADVQYDSYRETLSRDSLFKSKNHPQEFIDKVNKDPELMALMKRMHDYDFSESYNHHFKGWKYFRELYNDLIIAGKLKEDFRWYLRFADEMYSCNRFFFPAMNGEQCGDDEASKRLLEVSLKIVNNNLKEYEEEYGDDESESESAEA